MPPQSQLNPKRRRTIRARQLRRDASNAERRLWGQLRRGVYGVRVRRQHPIGPLIVDFATPSRRLAIEVDGEGHQPDEDRRRDALLNALGWHVMRIAVQDHDRDMDGVLEALARVIEDPALLSC